MGVRNLMSGRKATRKKSKRKKTKPAKVKVKVKGTPTQVKKAISSLAGGSPDFSSTKIGVK